MNDPIQSANISELAKALNKFQAFGVVAKKTSENPFFHSKYADLNEIWSAVRKPMVECGLAVTQTTTTDSNNNILVTTLLHESGEFLRGYYILNPAKKDPQGEGSAMSYARRYCLAAILGIATEDDDAESSVSHDPVFDDDGVPETPKPKTGHGDSTISQRNLIANMMNKHFKNPVEQMKYITEVLGACKTDENTGEVVFSFSEADKLIKALIRYKPAIKKN